MFRLTIAMVWNNLVALYDLITSAATSSTDFGVLVRVIGSLDPSIDDPRSCTIFSPIQIQMGILLQILVY